MRKAEYVDEVSSGCSRYESRLAIEVVDILLEQGFITEYWLDPSGNLIKATGGHRAYAVTHVLDKSEFKTDAQGDMQNVYAAMAVRGWTRVIIEHENNTIIADTYACSAVQLRSLKREADRRNHDLVDDKSGRVVYTTKDY